MLLILQALIVGSCLLGLSEASGELMPYRLVGTTGGGLNGIGVIYRRKATGKNRGRGRGGGNKAASYAKNTRYGARPYEDDKDEYDEEEAPVGGGSYRTARVSYGGERKMSPAKYKNAPARQYDNDRDDDDDYNENGRGYEAKYGGYAGQQGRYRGNKPETDDYERGKPEYGRDMRGYGGGHQRYSKHYDQEDDEYDEDDEGYRAGRGGYARGEANFYNYVPGFVINPRHGNYASDRYPKLPDIYYNKCFYGGKVQQNCFPYTDYYKYDMKAYEDEDERESYPRGGDYQQQRVYQPKQRQEYQQRYRSSPRD